MTGLLVKKYHVAVLDTNDGIVPKIIDALKSWYSDRIVIKTYKDGHDMFEAVSLNQAKNKPFDMAVLSPSEFAEKLILQRVNPSLRVVVWKDENALRTETSKLML